MKSSKSILAAAVALQFLAGTIEAENRMTPKAVGSQPQMVPVEKAQKRRKK